MAEMDEMAKGAFQEAGNIGMGHLATSLSKMVSRDVKIDIPVVEMLSLDDIIAKSNEEGKNKSVVGIHLHISGEVNGGTLILLPKFSALSFSDLLMKKPIGSTSKIEEPQQRKLREMGVNLCSAYMRVVNEFLGIDMTVGDPSIEVNMEGVGDFIKKEIGDLADQFIVVKGECLIPSTNSKNEFNMLFEPEATDIIMAAIMKKMMG
ncbi:chemotaxis protein CheC [Methanolobus profundi]|uniref:Chemotaxis protein CheC n=1 Tax=Methanolobus profundi TaxID=487685 RepID=A0A1I4NJV7_9EURY|nr:chemotaxis protein CheC [Methanolobus profundi]SFM15751.1 chemotaxis protein CheC [Methanolobus profundi]